MSHIKGLDHCMEVKFTYPPFILSPYIPPMQALQIPLHLIIIIIHENPQWNFVGPTSHRTPIIQPWHNKWPKFVKWPFYWLHEIMSIALAFNKKTKSLYKLTWYTTYIVYQTNTWCAVEATCIYTIISSGSCFYVCIFNIFLPLPFRWEISQIYTRWTIQNKKPFFI